MNLSNNEPCYEVSVIIPTYQPGNYLYECLQSVFNQTLDKKLYEIVVVLNGPKDPYYKEISTYINNNKKECSCFLLYSFLANVSNARNVGLEKCRGKNICFIDDDDIVSTEYLASLYKEVCEGVIVISDVFSFVENITECGTDFFVCKYLENFSDVCSLVRNRGFLAFPVAKMIPLSIIDNRKFDKRFKHGEDALFMTIISDKIRKFSLVKEGAVYYVRKRKGSATNRQECIYDLIKESSLLILAYMSWYLKHPFKYSFRLFFYRIPGVIKSTYLLIKKQHKIDL